LSNTAHRFAHVTPSTGDDDDSTTSAESYVSVSAACVGEGTPSSAPENCFPCDIRHPTSHVPCSMSHVQGGILCRNADKSCLLIGAGSHVKSHSQVNFVGPRGAPGVTSKTRKEIPYLLL